MTPKLRENLLRLLHPRHIAVIGGADAQTVVGECARIGYTGPLWPVNPNRGEIGGHACFARIENLPEPPDAAFVAVNRDAAIDTVAALSRMGAGGVVCYSAGFAEIGGEGAEAEARLIEAAGDVALIGPNCYGVLNYVNRVALWPFAYGGACPGYGAAIVTQSGMLSSDLTMSRRSVPFAYMVSAGNQAVLGLEDFVDVLAERVEVRAIGLHVEGLKDVPAFSAAAVKALRAGKPIVALKTGSSEIGAQLTVSHTASLSGADDLYAALFDRLGIIRVATPAQLLETLKFLCVAGVPDGRRIAGLTCSGGNAAMLADRAEEIGLEFPPAAAETVCELKSLLPHTATVSNPLDYTTPIWGMAERTGPVFKAMLRDAYDAAVIVQDYPLAGLDESKPAYLNDTIAFVAAAKSADVPAAVCSTLPENLDVGTRDMLVGHGVAPMQGIHEALDAIAGAAWYGRRRREILDAPQPPIYVPQPVTGTTEVMDEAAGKACLRNAGLEVPDGRLADGAGAGAVADELGYPVALKMIGAGLAHKTEAGAVALGLADRTAVDAAVARMRKNVETHDASACTDVFLVERIIDQPVAELLVGIRSDSQFGHAMTLASGGVLVELIDDAVTVLLPASQSDLAGALERLKLARLLDGFRGRPAADRGTVVDALDKLARYVTAHASQIAELEINPLFILPDRVCAVDVLIHARAADQG